MKHKQDLLYVIEQLEIHGPDFVPLILLLAKKKEEEEDDDMKELEAWAENM